MKRALLVALLLSLVGCKKKAVPPPDERPPPLTAVEAERGRDACKDYVGKLCACARVRNTPQLAQECELASGIPGALDMALQIDGDATADMRAASAAQDQITKMTARCVQELAKLPGRGCP